MWSAAVFGMSAYVRGYFLPRLQRLRSLIFHNIQRRDLYRNPSRKPRSLSSPRPPQAQGKPTARAKSAEVHALLAGDAGATEIAKKLGIGGGRFIALSRMGRARRFYEPYVGVKRA
jgi:hypothetical protein